MRGFFNGQDAAREHVENEGRQERRSSRLLLPLLLTAAAVFALSALGGVSYAATQVEPTLGQMFTLNGSTHVSLATSGHDQYRSGYSWGSPAHTHSGAPGIGLPGSLLPPLIGKVKGGTMYVSTAFTIDEQAHLFVSVIDDSGTEYLITQNKTRIGEQIHGAQAKVVNYLVLIPRTIPINLGIPKNLLVPGQHYRIRIIARAPNFQKQTLYIGFTVPAV